jgi:3-deoxy-D-manno-octulosonate 8-phosphate phosphatase (KDO 8-P phosphatase)
MTKDEAFAARCRALRLVLMDVDGVLTDGTVLLLPDGREAKSFHIRDGLGIVLAQRAGLKMGVLSGRASESLAARAAELRLDVVRQGVSDKRKVFEEILKEHGLLPQEVAYIGDDLNDLCVLTEVGLSAAPADAPFEVRAQAFMVTDTRGGQGCVREFLEAILKARGQWESLLSAIGARLP